jgi:hypothetical protein
VALLSITSMPTTTAINATISTATTAELVRTTLFIPSTVYLLDGAAGEATPLADSGPCTCAAFPPKQGG